MDNFPTSNEEYDSPDEDFSVEQLRELLGRMFGNSSVERVSDFLPAVFREPYYDVPHLQRPPASREIDGLPTGFTDLDQLLGGLRPGELITIANDPSSGSSTFLLNILRKSLRGIQLAGSVFVYPKVAYCTLQSSQSAIVERLVCAEARIDEHNLRVGNIKSSDLLRLEATRYNLLSKGNAYFLDDYGLTISNLRQSLIPLKIRRDIDLLIIDCVECIGVDRDGDINLEKTMTGLRGIASHMNIPVLLACHYLQSRRLSRGEQPVVAHVPPQVSLYSDVIVLMHRSSFWQPPISNHRNIMVEKGVEVVDAHVAYQRNRVRGLAQLVFQPRWSRFDNIRWHM